MTEILRTYNLFRGRGFSYTDTIHRLAGLYHYSESYMRKLVTKVRKHRFIREKATMKI